MSADPAAAITAAWERRAEVTPARADARKDVEAALALPDSGKARVHSVEVPDMLGIKMAADGAASDAG